MRNLKNKKPARIPTDEDYRNYDGAHCFHLWNGLSDSWVCPACLRSKREIMRWTKRQARPVLGIMEDYYGWMAGLHRHHDHTVEYGSSNTRFLMTVICDQCNAAEGRAKRQLSLPKDFSFAPAEIRRFVNPIPHGRHTVELEIAKQIFDSLP